MPELTETHLVARRAALLRRRIGALVRSRGLFRGNVIRRLIERVGLAPRRGATWAIGPKVQKLLTPSTHSFEARLGLGTSGGGGGSPNLGFAA